MVEAHRVRPGKETETEEAAAEAELAAAGGKCGKRRRNGVKQKNQKRNVDKREWSCRMRSSIPFKIQITDSKPYRRI